MGIALFIIYQAYPCYINKYLFDSKWKTNAEIMTFIGVVVGGIILWLNLIQNTRRNNQMQKSNIDSRFKDAATLFCSQDTSAILAGIFALHQLFLDSKLLNQDEYVNIIKEIFIIVFSVG